ncbi:MAG: hypothetical protein ACO3YV_04555 [Pelagibacteraceae bacterium]|jgi:hypothetical protein
METFYFFIPLAVVAAMGLINDGLTVSREVRVSDLLTDGSITVNEYLALAKGGVVFMPIALFTFQSVEVTTEGWVCAQLEPEPLAWEHTLSLLREMFPSGDAWSKAVRLPYYVEDGTLYVYFNNSHPDAEALASAGWARAIDTSEYDDGPYSDPFTYDDGPYSDPFTYDDGPYDDGPYSDPFTYE